jgi:acyl carrier protein
MPDTLIDVQNIVAKQLGVELNAVQPESLLAEELGANSLDKVEIIIRIEERYDIIIHDNDAKDIRTVSDAVKAIDERVAQREEKLDISF